MKLPIGVSDFKEIQTYKYTFVDKSLLIKDIIDNSSKVIIFTRPRRFGKTLNMSMLYHYFALSEEDKSGLFKDLEIWKQGEHYQRHQGKYPVIFIRSMRSIVYSKC